MAQQWNCLVPMYVRTILHLNDDGGMDVSYLESVSKVLANFQIGCYDTSVSLFNLHNTEYE